MWYSINTIPFKETKMKKKVFSILLTLALSLCFISGCSEPTALSFNTAFFGETAPSSAYSETLIYKISYSDTNLSENIKNSPNSSFEFSEGEKKVRLTVLPEKPTLPDGKETDLFSQANDSTRYYSLYSETVIPVKYVIGEQVYEHLDTISQTVFFFDHTLSYAPIYSETNIDYTVYVHGSENSFLQKVKTSSCAIYNYSSYTVQTFNEKENGEIEESKNNYEYTFKTLIDNNQLLFALRNTRQAEGETIYLPTVSYTYGEAQELNVKYQTSGTKTLEINYNGSLISEPIGYKEIIYNINSINTAGAYQRVCIQKEKTDNLLFKSLLLIYEEPIVAYGTYSPMGTLVYTLSQASHS